MRAHGRPRRRFRRGSQARPGSFRRVADVDLSPSLRKRLLEYKLKTGCRADDILFRKPQGAPIGDGKCPVIDKITGAMSEVCGARVTLHDCRHTFGSRLLEASQDIGYVSLQLGHSNVQTTANIYIHAMRSSRPEVVKRIEEKYFFEGLKIGNSDRSVEDLLNKDRSETTSNKAK